MEGSGQPVAANLHLTAPYAGRLLSPVSRPGV